MPARGKGHLRIATEDFISTYLYDSLIKPTKRIILVGARNLLKRRVTGFFKLLGANNLASQFDSILDDLNEDDSIILILTTVPMIIGVLFSLISGAFAQVPLLLVTYGQNRIFEAYRADISSYVQMGFRNPAKKNIYKNQALDLGLNNALYEDFESIYRPLLPPTEAMILLNRGDISVDKFKEVFSKQGWTEEDIQLFDKLRFVIPPISDLIRMAVREAFDQQIIDKFGYADGFPTDITEFTDKLGLSEDWVRRYWYAHWDLPSSGQGYTMLHRLRPGKSDNPFTESELELLLRAADVPAYYRKRLIEISYTPITRVDIRRLRQEGVFNKENVIDAYLDIGYNRKNAEFLAEFVEQQYGEARKKLSRSLIERGYKNGFLSEQEAISKLGLIGYSTENATYLLRLLDFRINEDHMLDLVDLAIAKFMRGLSSESDLRGRLTQIGITDSRVNALVEKAVLARENREKFPTSREFIEMVTTNLMSVTEYREELVRQGYSSQNIDRLIKLNINQ